MAATAGITTTDDVLGGVSVFTPVRASVLAPPIPVPATDRPGPRRDPAGWFADGEHLGGMRRTSMMVGPGMTPA
jgi:hypothetical protein